MLILPWAFFLQKQKQHPILPKQELPQPLSPSSPENGKCFCFSDLKWSTLPSDFFPQQQRQLFSFSRKDSPPSSALPNQSLDMKRLIFRFSLQCSTFRVFVTPDVSFLPQDVDVEFLPEAEVHTGGMKFVEQDVHPPGSQERCPSDQHHHPHLWCIQCILCIFYHHGYFQY